MIDYREMEERWLRAWDDAKLFEAEPNDREAVLVTAAWPYPYMPQHIGHLRTYGTADFYARYLRMKGYNVLFPMGFHRTGTPVLATVKRILQDDKEIKDEYELYHIDWATAKSLADPEKLTAYFADIYKADMRRAGFSIDWRRNFTSTDPIYSKMVEWQFAKLQAKGFLVQGRHPVGWCPNEGNAIGQHDTKHDVDPKIEEMTVIKFRDADSDAFFPCATFRPETIYGVTNLFINDKAEYVIASLGGERFYMGKEAAATLAYQLDVKVEGGVSAQELLAKKAVNPVTGDSVPVLPGYFVKADFATGVVMSVPAHAPFDYVALKRLEARGAAGSAMQPKAVVKLEGTDTGGKVPALAYLEKAGANTESDDALVEEATKQIYKDEQRGGVMLLGEHAGKKVAEARELIKASLTGPGGAMSMYVMSNPEPVYCRCGYRAVVKVVDNQWFIDYGNKGWKEQVRLWFPEMKIFPEKMRNAYNATIEWLGPKPMERAQGIGTRFPLNPEHIIEPLSDSTIYMAFYTFVNLLNGAGVKPEQLKPEFFDYVLNGEGAPEAVSTGTGIDSELIKRCRESFTYWYKFTSRHSAYELIPSHLTFYIFNHLAVFPKEYWPKQIVTNGMVNISGAAMHRSIGNVMPLMDAIGKFGADTLRFIQIVGSDLESDVDFMPENAGSILAKNQFLYNQVSGLDSMEAGALGHIDYWLYSKLNSKIRSASAAMDGLQLRDAYVEIYYNSINELRWYAARGGANALVVRDFLEKTVLMLSPAMPFLTEELWHMLGKNGFVAKERWPDADDNLISPAIEATEQMIQGTMEDAEATMALTAKMDANKGKKISRITVILAAPWKAQAYNALCEKRDIGAVIADPSLKDVDRQQLSKFLAQYAKRMNTLARMEGYDAKEVLDGFSEAAEYMGSRLGTEVSIESEAESKSQRAQRAMPGKPSLDIEWE